MKTTHLCNCSRGNDMTCPLTEPLSKLVQRLEPLGYEKEAHVIDAMWAKSLLAEWTKCGSRGGFGAIGFRRKEAHPSLLDLSALLPLDRGLRAMRRMSQVMDTVT